MTGEKSVNNGKIMLGIIIAIMVIAVSSLYFMQTQEMDAMILNDFNDDIIDRNDDYKINWEDYPIEWKSFEIGDNITIRDRISYIHITGNEDYTGTFIRIDYTGKYNISGDELNIGVAHVNVYEDLTDKYQEGDFITIKTTIVSNDSYTGAEVGSWEIVS